MLLGCAKIAVMLGLLGYPADLGGVMAAIVRPRIITITNSADALPLQLHIADYLDSVSYRADRTQRAYRSDLFKFRDFLGSDSGVEPLTVMFHEVSRSSIEKFRDALLHQGESPSTVQRRLDVVKAFCRYIRDKYHIGDRAAGVRGVSRERPKFIGLTDEQYDRLLLELDKSEPTERFLNYFILETGFRQMSAQAATFGHLAPDWSWFRDVPAKGRKTISVPVSRKLRQELSRYLDSHRGQWPVQDEWPILLSTYGAVPGDPKTFNISQHTIWNRVHAPMMRAGILRSLCHPHTLRHTFGQRLLDRISLSRGGDKALIVTSRALGHTNIQTTMQYLGVEDRILMEAMGA